MGVMVLVIFLSLAMRETTILFLFGHAWIIFGFGYLFFHARRVGHAFLLPEPNGRVGSSIARNHSRNDIGDTKGSPSAGLPCEKEGQPRWQITFI